MTLGTPGAGNAGKPKFAPSPNFDYLGHHDMRLVQTATMAERVRQPLGQGTRQPRADLLGIDPGGSLRHLRLFGELMVQNIAARWGVYEQGSTTAELTRDISRKGLPVDINRLFRALREEGNRATHDWYGDQQLAFQHIKIAFQLAIWFQRTFGNNRKFNPGPYAPPRHAEGDVSKLQDELDALRKNAQDSQRETEAARAALHHALQEENARALGAEAAAKKANEEALLWETYAAEAEAKANDDQQALATVMAELDAVKRQYEDALLELQLGAAQATPEQERVRRLDADETAAAIELDEPATRLLIDQQLRDAGWEVDSQTLRYGKGVRSQKNKFMAIAEWPTESGPADYVLFLGLRAVGVVEAKKRSVDVSAALEQAKRYSRGFKQLGAELCGGPWGEYRVPFLFSTNGRPYLKQLETKSGIWHVDVRRPQNLAKALDGWHSPEGLEAMLKQDIDAANLKLTEEPADSFGLREYQVNAIHAVERAVAQGAETCLVAMATGTGKTRTAIALVYRLIKSGRFRRVLFLVDRSALGEQTGDALQEIQLENLQTFPEIYDLKRLDDIQVDTDTKLHIATVQGMVRRLLDPSEAAAGERSVAPTVDTYDCIVVDECHRGYGLDQELTDAEFKLAEYGIRTQADYISRYRRVLEHFDAVKIGLTATPAAHTTEIFGKPTYQYGYREAVIDGFLIDHEPPVSLITKLAEEGIHFEKGSQVRTFDAQLSLDALVDLEDEVKLEIESFNKRVVTENFNRVVCTELAKHIDPGGDEKTLIFAATDHHADLVVKLLKEAFQDQYGEVDDDAVQKITGTADKPLARIRHFKNERYPNVVVTVDLLTTGIDVPKICNLVFLRRIRSRVLYEQMLGRATRLCPEIGKETFLIYDAVALYEALQPVTNMKPVVARPQVSFRDLVREIQEVSDEEARQAALDQLIAKLQRKKQRLTGDALERFVTAAELDPTELAQQLKHSTPAQAAEWFHQHQYLVNTLERAVEPHVLMVSDHHDELRRVERGYGKGEKPDDYLDAFKRFIDENLNALLEMFTLLYREPVIVQRYIPEVRAGDKRIILVDGEIAGAINRVPSVEETRSNMHVGGRPEKIGLSERDLEICARIGPLLREKGQIFVGIDVIGNWLTEINVTSPTGLQELERFDGVNVTAKIWEAIERRRAAQGA